MGTSHQALIITVGEDSTTNLPHTANDVVNAFLNVPLASKFSINVSGSNGSGSIFLADTLIYTEPTIRIYDGALTGATSGTKTNVTAQELMDFVNNDAVLSKIIQADLGLNTPNGNGKLTIFDEFAYYGDPNMETGLQFLGPKDSKPIIFDDGGGNAVNQQLDMYFSPDVLGYAQTSIAAQNANAAIQINSRNKGADYDDMVVRYVALDSNAAEGYVNYTEGESNSMAYCSIENADTGSDTETGKFILYANDPGSIYNNVNIVAKLDLNQGEPAKAYFDKNTNQFIISVNSDLVTLSQAMAAIEADGTFTADYDFSYNNLPSNNGPADKTFAGVFSSTSGPGSITSAIIGNTGETGGHKGGVLTVALATKAQTPPVVIDPAHQYPTTYDAEGKGYSASDVAYLINNDSVAKNLFTAANYPGSTGLGAISFRDDNLKTVTGGDGQTRIVPSAVSTGGVIQEGYMVIQLATDQYGNSITTARDIVNLFDSLPEEYTRGVSVSLVRPAGQDNLLRTWTDDGCGNITVTQECEDDFGKGIIQPTTDKDDCDNIIYYPLEFTSFGSDIRETGAQGDIISVNGWESQFRITAKNAGTQYENTSIVYRAITDGSDTAYAEWDPLEKQIIVHVSTTNTTAADVKGAIEGGLETGKLFKVDLKVNGSALVTLTDDALKLKNGTFEAGYRGGAHMLGAADADPHKLTFESTEEGSSQFVRVNIIEGNPKIVDENGVESNRAVGVDVDATLNGTQMVGYGNSVSLYTTMLQLSMTLANTVQAGDVLEFKINGGGATFQLGPDVTTNQQIRLGLPSVSTSSLGGASGRLFQLRSDGDAALAVNTKLADLIVQEAISAVTSLRGRLGAIQRCTLDPNIAALQDNLEAMSAAEAEISNADFATESSRLSRAQILIQSGSQTLGIANQMPQYAASLLG
jgi:flagellin-like hook-associated protein FlgL